VITKICVETMPGTRLSATAHGVPAAGKPMGTGVSAAWRQRPGYLGFVPTTTDNSTRVSDEERRHT
jgi:hypothetical protein